MNQRLFRLSLVGILGIAVVGSTLALTPGSPYAFFDPLVEVQSLIARRYVGEPDLKEMQEGAINGMLEALKDPYTTYVPASDSVEFTKDLTGDYVGIGVQVMAKDGWLTVVTPLEDSPAFRAGVLAEDRIVEIDGTSTIGLSAEKCVSLLSGEAGAKVAIVVEREGQRLPMELTRERVIARTVKGFHRTEDGNGKDGGWQYFIDPGRQIAYLRLTQFTPTSAEEVEEALRAIGADAHRVRGLILDVRWNPGGVLQDATRIADLFLDEGVIVSTRGRVRAEEVSKAKKEGTLPDFPIAVLINGSSASASEVLAGALVENDRAIAVGTRSFGKGLVQAVITLPSGVGQLKMTEQRYYLPSGRCIQRDEASAEWGVDPTAGFYVPMTDEQTVAMLKERREQDAIGRARSQNGERWSDPEWIVERLKDVQLAAALRAVQGRIDRGAWEATGGPLPESTSLASAELEKAARLRGRLEKELVRLDERIDRLEAASGAQVKPVDLWPEEDLSGGRVEVYDKGGRLISRLSITGPDLERWLVEADVEREGAKGRRGEGTK